MLAAPVGYAEAAFVGGFLIGGPVFGGAGLGYALGIEIVIKDNAVNVIIAGEDGADIGDFGLDGGEAGVVAVFGGTVIGGGFAGNKVMDNPTDILVIQHF